jgi:hypothetical protein
MESREFIVKELENLIKQFPQIKVRYGYDERANTHFIEVVPFEVYNANDEYLSWEAKTLIKYVKLYPTEGLCFISDDDPVDYIDNVELTLYGVEYAQKQRKKKRVAEAIFE